MWIVRLVLLGLLAAFVGTSRHFLKHRAKYERLLENGREQAGINAALVALLLSLTGVVLLSFYLDQFQAVVTALFQFGVLLLVLAYRRWYLEDVSS